MPINNLIAMGGVNPGVARSFYGGKQDAQRGQMNNLAMQGTRQSHNINQEKMQMLRQEQTMKMMASAAQYLDTIPEEQRAQVFESMKPKFAQYGAPVPEGIGFEQAMPRLQQAKIQVFGVPEKVETFSPVIEGGRPVAQRSDLTNRVYSDPRAPSKVMQGTPGEYNNPYGSKATDKYWENRVKGQAERVETLEKEAASAFDEIKALDRFMESSKGSTEGGAQPIITGVKNFLTSFGAEFEGLEDMAQMQQAVADIKTNYLRDLGARGLTDKDMEIINAALPRMNTSQEARENVVRILQKAQANKIKEWEFMKKEEQRVFPSKAGEIFNPKWYSEYQSYSSDELSPAELQELEMRESLLQQGAPQQGGFGKIERTDR